jgi:hypothetical protein
MQVVAVVDQTFPLLDQQVVKVVVEQEVQNRVALLTVLTEPLILEAEVAVVSMIHLVNQAVLVLLLFATQYRK